MPELLILGQYLPPEMFKKAEQVRKIMDAEQKRKNVKSRSTSRLNALRRIQELMVEQQQLQNKLLEIMDRYDRGLEERVPVVNSNEYWLAQFNKTGRAAYAGIQPEDIPKLRAFAEIPDIQKPDWVQGLLNSSSASDNRVGQALQKRYIDKIGATTFDTAEVYQCTSSKKQCGLSVGMCRLGEKTASTEVGSCACNILTGKCLNTASVYRTHTGRGTNPMTYYMQSPEFRVTKAKLDMVTQRLAETRKVVGYFK